jgi:hypothetical protein
MLPLKKFRSQEKLLHWILGRRLLKMLSMWQLRIQNRRQLRIKRLMILRIVLTGLTTATKTDLADISTIDLADSAAALAIGSTTALMIGHEDVLTIGLAVSMIALAAASMTGMIADVSETVMGIGMLMSVPMTGLSGLVTVLGIVPKAVHTDPDDALMTAREGLTAAPMTAKAGHTAVMIQMMN